MPRPNTPTSSRMTAGRQGDQRPDRPPRLWPTRSLGQWQRAPPATHAPRASTSPRMDFASKPRGCQIQQRPVALAYLLLTDITGRIPSFRPAPIHIGAATSHVGMLRISASRRKRIPNGSPDVNDDQAANAGTIRHRHVQARAHAASAVTCSTKPCRLQALPSNEARPQAAARHPIEVRRSAVPDPAVTALQALSRAKSDQPQGATVCLFILGLARQDEDGGVLAGNSTSSVAASRSRTRRSSRSKLDWTGAGRQPESAVVPHTNVDQIVTAGPVSSDPGGVTSADLREPTPYITVRPGAGRWQLKPASPAQSIMRLVALSKPPFCQAAHPPHCSAALELRPVHPLWASCRLVKTEFVGRRRPA